MKCNCSSINKYEIIGLCDIKKFNEKIKEFDDKSWTQVVISDNVAILGARLNIKTITKTVVNVKIISTKLINTPKSEDPSVEGLKLTGKLLLIGGEIKQRILYISNCGNSDRIHSFKIKSPFTSYIVVDESVDIAQDKFCIYPCIEYSSVRPINECTLNQNVTLFLFAHKTNNPNPNPPDPPIPPPPPEPKPPYKNTIIAYNSKNEKVVEVSFTTNDRRIEVVSTGNKLDDKLLKWFLSVAVVSKDGRFKNEGEIFNGGDGTGFKTALDGTEYDIGDIIYISTGTENFANTKITNYPRVGENYFLTEDFKRFKITDNGIVAMNHNLYPNEISLRTSTAEEFCKMIFPFSIKKISFKDIDDSIMEAGVLNVKIIEVKLYKSDGKTLKIQKEINQEENIVDFLTTIQGTDFEYGDVIQINSTDNRSRIEISNFPTDGQKYTPKNQIERFRIGFDRLSRELSPPPKTYPNDIIFKNDDNKELAKVIFNIEDNKLIVINTTKVQTGVAQVILKFELFNSDGTTKRETGQILGNQNATQFYNDLNGKAFNYDDIINITYYTKPNRVQITDYPTSSQTYQPTLSVNEAFIVTQTGLVPYILPNKIISNNGRNQKVVEVDFAKIDKKIKVISTGNKLDNQLLQWFLSVALVSPAGIFKNEGRIFHNEDGIDFKQSLDNIYYSIGDIIYILTGRKNFSNTQITNYPRGADTYYLKEKFERFKITDNGLVENLPNIYPNEISLRTNSGEQFAKLIFPFSVKKMSFTDIDDSVREDSGSTRIIIKVKLYEEDGTTLKREKEINQGENIENFIINIQGQDFEYGDIIEIDSTDDTSRIEISNFPIDGEMYTPTNQVERFRIGFDRFTKVNN